MTSSTSASGRFPSGARCCPRGRPASGSFAYIAEYGKEVTKACEEVLKNPMPIARVNAARILAHLGKTGPEEVADPLPAWSRTRLKSSGQAICPPRAQGPADQRARDERQVQGPSPRGEDRQRPGRVPASRSGDSSRAPPEAQVWVRNEAVPRLANGQAPLLDQVGSRAQPASSCSRSSARMASTPNPTSANVTTPPLASC